STTLSSVVAGSCGPVPDTPMTASLAGLNEETMMKKEDAAPSTVVKTLPQLAAELGVDRSTMVRWEQKGIIPLAPLAGKPVQGRVYDKDLERKVKAAVDKHLQKRAIAAANRPKAPKNFIV